MMRLSQWSIANEMRALGNSVENCSRFEKIPHRRIDNSLATFLPIRRITSPHHNQMILHSKCTRLVKLNLKIILWLMEGAQLFVFWIEILEIEGTLVAICAGVRSNVDDASALAIYVIQTVRPANRNELANERKMVNTIFSDSWCFMINALHTQLKSQSSELHTRKAILLDLINFVFPFFFVFNLIRWPT